MMHRINLITHTLNKKKPENNYRVSDNQIISDNNVADLLSLEGDEAEKFEKGVKCEKPSVIYVEKYGIYFNTGKEGRANLTNSTMICRWSTYINNVLDYLKTSDTIPFEVSTIIKQQEAVLGMVTKMRKIFE